MIQLCKKGYILNNVKRKSYHSLSNLRLDKLRKLTDFVCNYRDQ